MIRRFTCETCTTVFERDTGGTYRFCSRACYAIHQTGRPKARAVMVQRTCGHCSASFESLSSGGARTRFCSRSCQGLFQAGRSATGHRTMTVAEAAYLAGMIDGEGSISIVDRSGEKPGSSRPGIQLRVSNTYTELLDWIVAKTGVGVIHHQKPSPNSPVATRKACYNWIATSVSACLVLRQVEPYLIEKRAKAILALAAFPHQDQIYADQPRQKISY